LQELISVAGLGVHNAPTLEAQPDVVHPTPLEDRREREADLPLGLGLDRAGEDLTVRHVELAVGGEPLAPGHVQPQVRVGPDDTQLGKGVQLTGACAELEGNGAPVGNRVLLRAHVACAVDEVLVVEQ
jgi:hypothetical protein